MNQINRNNMKKSLALISSGLLVAGTLTAGNYDNQDHMKNKDKDWKDSSAQFEKVNDRTYSKHLQSSDLLDASVIGKDQNQIGTITDFELNKDGEIEALYIELDDGVLGLFGNTVVRAEYDDFEFSSDQNRFTVKESIADEFTQFVSNFIEETEEAAESVAQNTEEGVENLINELEESDETGPHMENVTVSAQSDRIYVRGEVESDQVRKRIIKKVENNTRLEVIDDVKVSNSKKHRMKNWEDSDDHSHNSSY